MPATSDLIALTATMLTMGSGAVIDLRTRRIPNSLTLATTVLGLVLAASGVTGISVGQSLAGFLVGIALMLPGHLLGATGAGDVKFLGAAGALLGLRRMPAAFVYTAIAGGILALFVAVARGRVRSTVRGATMVVTSPRKGRQEVESPQAGNRFAYGPAIATGAILAAFGL